MSEQRSYLHRRFGATIARRFLNVWFVGMLIVFVGFLIVGAVFPFGAIRWIVAVACCTGLAILARMYKTGIAELGDKNKVA